MSRRVAFHSKWPHDQPTSKLPPGGRGGRRQKRRSPKKAVRVIARALESTVKFPLSIFPSGAAHARDLWQRKNSLRDLVARQFFDLFDADCVVDIESTGLGPPQRFQMRAAAE